MQAFQVVFNVLDGLPGKTLRRLVRCNMKGGELG
jgi:hypothetical protein